MKLEQTRSFLALSFCHVQDELFFFVFFFVFFLTKVKNASQEAI